MVIQHNLSLTTHSYREAGQKPRKKEHFKLFIKWGSQLRSASELTAASPDFTLVFKTYLCEMTW